MTYFHVENLTKKFGGLVAVDHCSFEVEEKSILGLIGPNGSGKTTIFNLITGFLQPDDGGVFFKGERISGLKPHVVASKGIIRSFQIVKPFGEMTVLDNLLAVSRISEIDKARERAFELLKTVNLIGLKDSEAQDLSYGQQKLLEFARMQMVGGAIFLLDEPTAGVHPLLKKSLMDYVKTLHAGGKTIILIEHDMRVITEICQKVIVLDSGQIIMEGSPADVQADERVKKSYFLI